MKQLISRCWQSATLMTWLNVAARMLSLIVVLPLVLRHFTAADVALYYLYASVITLQLMAGSGCVPTFARFISYALSGATMRDLERLRNGVSGEAIRGSIDPTVVSRIYGTLNRVFFVLSIGTVPIVAAAGSCLLAKPISASSSPFEAWFAWAIVVTVTPLSLFSTKFSALLQGANKVALEQRWSAIFVVAGSISGMIALISGGGLLALVAVNQFWQVLAIARLAWLARVALNELPFEAREARYSSHVFRAVWPGSWKSVVGVLFSAGITAASGLTLAQFLTSDRLAEFMLGIRIMAVVAEVSRAPFYSKLPVLNSLRASNDNESIGATAHRSMRLAYASFIALFFSAPIAAAAVLPLIKSNVAFPDVGFWCLLGSATLVERFGAMHVQIYSTTNDIIWHWLNGITGVLWIGLMFLLAPWLDYWAYAVAMLFAYSACYSSVAACKSLGSLKTTFWQFERRCFVPAAALFLSSTAVLMLLQTLLLRPTA